MIKSFTNRFILILVIFFTTSSCSKVIYNVDYVKKPNCATEKDSLTLRVYNEGKIGISNIKIKTQEGFISMGGVESGKTICPLPIHSFYNYPAYQIYLLQKNGVSNLIETFSVDHIGDDLLKNGNYTLSIAIKNKGSILEVTKFEIIKTK